MPTSEQATGMSEPMMSEEQDLGLPCMLGGSYYCIWLSQCGGGAWRTICSPRATPQVIGSI